MQRLIPKVSAQTLESGSSGEEVVRKLLFVITNIVELFWLFEIHACMALIKLVKNYKQQKTHMVGLSELVN